MLLFDVNALKNPATQVLHVGWAVAEPGEWVYFPGGHLVWAVHESVTVLLFDVNALKNPTMHTSHVGWTVAEPGEWVYLPGGHLVWAAHVRLGHPIIVCWSCTASECA